MPNPLVKSYASKAKKSVQAVEKIWDEAKVAAEKAIGKKGPRYWAYVNAVTKKRLGLAENMSFKEYVDMTKPEVELVEPSSDPTEIDQIKTNYAIFISCLFAARDKAHELHLATKYYTKHISLNELYDLLLEFADQMTETYQGKHGLLKIDIPAANIFNQHCELTFIVALADWLNGPARAMIGSDGFIINIFEELLGDVYRIKYKLENLQ